MVLAHHECRFKPYNGNTTKNCPLWTKVVFPRNPLILNSYVVQGIRLARTANSMFILKWHFNAWLPKKYEVQYKSNASSFFSENITAVTMKFMWMIHVSFANMRLFFHKVSIIFNARLPTLSRTQYTSVVKFSASTLEHITSGTEKLQKTATMHL
jgi:hypothetical protein